MRRPDGRLAAVLDFGDLGAGDPALDLAVAWLMFDVGARHRFIAAFGNRALRVEQLLSEPTDP